MRFPIGISDFKTLRSNKSSNGKSYFYFDKSLLIKDIIDDGAKILLFTRPRRFGKTLNMSMLKYFFGTKDNLFKGLKISEYKNILKNYQGQYPTIFITFKSMNCKTYEEYIDDLRKMIALLYNEFSYLKDSQKLDESIKNIISVYYDVDSIKLESIETSLFLLTKALYQHHEKEVMLLIDEYDTPLQKAYLEGYFKKAVFSFRKLMSNILKDNAYLFKGILTGIAGISKENMFSGLNHICVYDINNKSYARYFGFTENEVKTLPIKQYKKDLKSWYNGYLFGEDVNIYNPWSVLNFLHHHCKLKPYWIDTSSNDLIKHHITADKMESLSKLINGESICSAQGTSTCMCCDDPFIALDYLENNKTAFFNLLFVSGYLTSTGKANRIHIPNLEILYFFENTVKSWFSRKTGYQFLDDFLNALIQGEVEKIQAYLEIIILESFSFHDVKIFTQESFYHGFLLGLTIGLKGRYDIKSNRESGFGRYDLGLFPKKPSQDPGIIIEVKIGKNVKNALKQIKNKAYITELDMHGCNTIHTFGFSFNGKDVFVEKN